MRITIVQSEIEEAIRNHILSQIQVQEGMEIDIDLRATRGAEGFQAEIDIHPEGQKSPAKAAAPKAEPTPSKPLAIEETVSKAKAGKSSKSTVAKTQVTKPEPVAAVAEEPAPELEAEPANEPVSEPVSEPEVQSAEAQAEVVAETPKVASIFANKGPKDEPQADEPKSETQSIFGGLKRPVNA